VVTSLVGRIDDSRQAQMMSNERIERISAEHIGKRPDPSIAERLARLPAVLAERGGDGLRVPSRRTSGAADRASCGRQHALSGRFGRAAGPREHRAARVRLSEHGRA
jgi:hypothetical protein